MYGIHSLELLVKTVLKMQKAEHLNNIPFKKLNTSPKEAEAVEVHLQEPPEENRLTHKGC